MLFFFFFFVIKHLVFSLVKHTLTHMSHLTKEEELEVKIGGKRKKRHKEKTGNMFLSLKTTTKLFPFHQDVKQQPLKLDTLNHMSRKFTP